MSKQVKKSAYVLVGLFLMMVVGCAGASKAKYSGFLETYPQFEPGKKGVDQVYLKETVNFGRYNKVMLDHVVFYFAEDSKYKGIHPDELKELSDAFHLEIAKALGDKYPIVDKPDSDVLRLRVAITDIEKSKPALSTVTTVMPIGLALSFIKKGATDKHTGVGKASMEAELLDSLSNSRVGAAIDTQSGKKTAGFTKWGGAKAAFKFWAERLRKWLDEVHGKK